MTVPVRRVRGPSHSLIWLAALAAITVVVLALWLPFGLRRAAWADAWFYHGALLNGATLVPLNNSRPLAFVTWALSYAFSPTSFVGLNIQILWFLLLKAALVYAIVRLLAPRATGLALAAALLAIIYPAEVGYFNDGYVSLHLGFNAYLLAVFFLLAHWRRQSRWLLLSAMLALAYTVFTYEAVLALAVGTPLLLVWQEGRVSRRVVRVSAIWLIPVVLYFVYLAALQSGTQGLSTRETGLLAAGLNVADPLAEVVGANLWNFGRHYVEAWISAITLSPFNRESPLALIGVAASGVAGLLMAVHIQADQRRTSGQWLSWPKRRWLGLLLLSVLWTALGYAVYSLASVRYDGWRISFYTVLGAGTTVALVLYALADYFGRVRWLLSGLMLALAGLVILGHGGFWLVCLSLMAAAALVLPTRWRFALLVSAVLSLAVTRQLDLHRWLTSEALGIQRIITNVVRAAPGATADTPIVLVVDPQEWGSSGPFNTSQHFEYALDLIHSDPGPFARVCPLWLPAWGWNHETCLVTGSGLELRFEGEITLVPWDEVVMLAVHPDGTVALIESLPEAWAVEDSVPYAPRRLLDETAPPPSGMVEMFNPRPLIGR